MQNDYDTNMGWWTDKPERADRNTFFSPMHSALKEKPEPVWVKVSVIVTIMFVFGVSLLRLFGLIS